MTPGEVAVSDVSKTFRRASADRSWRTILRGRERVTALADVNVHVSPGEMLGLIGVNGSGKSTLLRIIAGISEPSVGSVEVGGEVAGILTLGAGFHPLFTGRENARTAAMLGGMSSRQVDTHLDEMLAFSELGDAVDEPVRSYSTGMIVRLAFAVASHVSADVLLVDEALSVGDLRFASKCLDHMETLQARGTTIVFSSHDLTTVRERCDRVMWLRNGHVVELGDAEEVVTRYEEASHRSTLATTPDHRRDAGRLGAGEVEVTLAALTTTDGRSADGLVSGAPLVVDLDVCARTAVGDVAVGVSLHNRWGDRCVDVHHVIDGSRLGSAPQRVRLTFDRLDLADGAHHVAIGVYPPDYERAYDYCWEAAWFTVRGSDVRGPLGPPHRWSVG